MAPSEPNPGSSSTTDARADVPDGMGPESAWPMLAPVDGAAGRGRSLRPSTSWLPDIARPRQPIADRAVPQEAKRRPAMVAMGKLLAAWRAAERDLEALAESHSGRARVQRRLDELRSTYQRLFSERRDGPNRS